MSCLGQRLALPHITDAKRHLWTQVFLLLDREKRIFVFDWNTRLCVVGQIRFEMKRYVWLQIFLNTEKRIFVFENTRLRVDGALVRWTNEQWAKATKVDTLVLDLKPKAHEKWAFSQFLSKFTFKILAWYNCESILFCDTLKQCNISSFNLYNNKEVSWLVDVEFESSLLAEQPKML